MLKGGRFGKNKPCFKCEKSKRMQGNVGQKRMRPNDNNNEIDCDLDTLIQRDKQNDMMMKR